MERENLESSLLKSAGYDAATKILEIEFLRGGIYQYFDAPEEVYADFQSAESKGRFFLRQIKDKFDYKKVEQDAENDTSGRPANT
jgi:hypothetical protein